MPDDRKGALPCWCNPRGAYPDGAFVFAPYDLKALEDAGIEWSFLAEEARPLRPDLLHGLNGLYHYSAPVTRASLEGVDGSPSSPATVLGSTSST